MGLGQQAIGTAVGGSRRRSKKDNYIGRVVAGRYRLETQIGEGGMGVVYRGRHVLIDRIVALKLIRPDLRGETHLRAWMLREARAANRVDHAHIVDIFDLGETEDGELYLVMEYLVGRSLAGECSKGPMPLVRAVDILEQMCAALARAHDLGVIHRDLKSDNIMLTNRGGRQDFVKILDFGLAWLAREARLAPRGAVFGTPEYMSPEQARGEDATASSDLYSLGILFFEMLTGQLPFRSSDRETLLEMQRSAPPTSPRALRREIPESAEQIVMRLLEKDPNRRFRDGHHLQEQLRALQRQLPSKPWDNNFSEAPAVPVGSRRRAPDVVEWSTKASHFTRMLARAYPNGQAPREVKDSNDQSWHLAASASRLEGELASHTRKLEAVERRGRALRAEIGRRVEDLAQEESRALREAGTERERSQGLRDQLHQARMAFDKTSQAVEASSSSSRDQLFTAYEAKGAARAYYESLQRRSEEHQQLAAEKEEHARNLRLQIDDLKQQLQRYGDALEADLTAGREKIASRVRQALEYEKSFEQAGSVMMAHLQDRPECRDLLKLLRSEHEPQTHVPSQP